MKPLRTAILGCGSFAHRHIGNILAHPDELALVASSDHHATNAQAFAAQYAPQAATHTGGAGLLAQEGVDLLVICLPPFAHVDEVELAASRGVHILVEKPIALDSAHAWRMVQAVTAEFVDANHATFHFTQTPDRAPRTVGEARNVYDAELMDLVHAIHTGSATRTPLRAGARSLDLALAATGSSQEGREVMLA